MIDDLDIPRAANILIKRHGADAAIEAARRADELLEAGDTDGAKRWEGEVCLGAAVVSAIDTHLTRAPSPGLFDPGVDCELPPASAGGEVSVGRRAQRFLDRVFFH
jgi:hypothetical protein